MTKPTIHWEPDPFVIRLFRYHLPCLERFDLHTKLKRLRKFLCFLVVLSGAQRRLESTDSASRMQRTMGTIMMCRQIKKLQAQLFRRRESILYPSLKLYPGGASDPAVRQANSFSLLDSDSEEHISCS